MAGRCALLLASLCAGLLSPVLAARTRQPAASSAISADMRPIRKVITLIQEMKVQAEKDAEADSVAYEKYMCWCTTNRKEKTAAITNAEQRIDELSIALDEGKAKEGAFKSEIASLADDIGSDKDALATATSVREKEKEAFLAEEADMKETRSLLAQAIEVLAKVQLLQKQGHAAENERQRAAEMLVQLRSVIQERLPKFRDVMQRDLFDVFGSLPSGAQEPHAFRGAFQQVQLLPWEKTEEQLGKEAKPNDLNGLSSGAKSYNSRSGSIAGMLEEMGDEFARDLFEAQKQDLEKEAEFQNLRAAKLGEIKAASDRKGQKEASLAATLDQAAKDVEEKQSTEEATAADQAFMATLEKNCASEDDEYKSRAAIRSEEIRALGEVLKILTDDTARDLYAKTESFVQLGAISSGQASTQASAQARAVQRAVQRIAKTANKGHSWALLSLAVRMQLDVFTKVKETMDKMLAELAKQQKEEYAKWESCKKNIDETEDSIKEGDNLKEDLGEKHQAVSDEIQTLTSEIAQLQKDIADVEISLKQAGEDRKAQNGVYQTSIADQRATTNILMKAQERLATFYSLEQTGTRAHREVRQEPGAAAPPPPASGKAYSKSALSGGVMQLLAKIIKDAEVAEKELEMSEQKAQEDYAAFVQTAGSTIEANRDAVRQREARLAQSKGEKSETEQAQLANDDDLAKLGDLLKAHHVGCDYLLKYFDVRQQARAEEIDAIKDAKAILSGSNFDS